ncbi:MAG: GNAT family N-acetyltransferase [Thermomicrobiales bacterium]|nr:GNAT family N-acetyltransferase [Thermomicrobiales bacterium]
MTVGLRARFGIATPSFEVRIARTQAEFAKIVAIRAAVFRDEQAIVAHELTDADDRISVHAYAISDGEVIAAGRLTPPTSSRPEGQIAWVAALPEHRGDGAGTAVMESLLAIADERRIPNVLISAQTHALDFYRRLGFVPYGDRFVVRGIEHQYMERHRQE